MKRFALIFGLAALLAGVVATPGSAASFDDTKPCPASGRSLSARRVKSVSPYTLQLRALVAATCIGGRSRTARFPRSHDVLERPDHRYADGCWPIRRLG